MLLLHLCAPTAAAVPAFPRYLGWLIKSPQATLPGYDPLVMSKAFMLRDAAALNPYNTK
jgi:hypothetical protein